MATRSPTKRVPEVISSIAPSIRIIVDLPGAIGADQRNAGAAFDRDIDTAIDRLLRRSA